MLDYHVVSETVDESGRTSRRVVLAAAYRDSIDRYVAACKAAGIAVVAVDLEAFALLRAVAPPAAGDEPAAVVAVTIGHDRTTLAISDGTVCDFTRVLEWGGSSLVAAIERELGRRRLRGGRAEARPVARGGRDARRRRRDETQVGPRARGGAARAAVARARPRRLASVLPGSARLAGDRGDPARGRNEPSARPRRRSSSA